MAKKKYYLGIVDGESYWLSAPSWDCNWYWGFGYIGNKNLHTHYDWFLRGKKSHHWLDLNPTDCPLNEKQSWRLAELMNTFYVLKETAEVLGRGGAYITDNPCKELIINKDEVERINKVVLPAIFKEIDKLFEETNTIKG